MKVNNTLVVSVGQAGNQIASSFWRTLCLEHGIDPTTAQCKSGAAPKGNWSAFFSKLGDGSSASYVPRSVMVDLEPSVINQIKATTGSLFNPANLITRMEGAGGNFAVGYMGAGREVLPEAMARLDYEISKCDHVGGIIVLHAIGGGSGSGFGSLLIEEIKEKYPEHPILSCAILPSPQVSSVVTEPYNTVFALSTLRRFADACLIFDNEALFNVAFRRWGIESPSVDDLNLLITEALAGLTAPMRFSGFLTVEISLRELLTNLVPQPSLHFLMCTFAPLTPPHQSKFEEMGIEEMIESMFRNESMFAACSPMEGRFLSTAVLYRGVMEDKPQADAALASIRGRLPLTYWIPTAFKIGYVEQPGITHRRSVVLVANNTEVSRVFERICSNFDKLWQRKAFANWYLNEGMSEEQITAMRASAQDLIQSYRVAEETGVMNRGQEIQRRTSTPALAPEPEPTPQPQYTPAPVSRPIPMQGYYEGARSSSSTHLRTLVERRY
ncbi:tubulin beta chain [Prosthecobacter debontii]|nr:tubulin beta chain [Prosthecobacter debontii]CAJ14022.1 bacterial tubulin A2 [Prosthecobacter debontii]